jgi:hypothetical protein
LEAKNQMRQTSLETQFGASYDNTPLLFLDEGFAGGFLGSPLVRQFLTFPLRTPLALIENANRLAGREGYSWQGALALDAIRAMGVSSLVYHGWQVIGQDATRGLMFDSAIDIVGGTDMLTGTDRSVPFQLPPFMSIPVDLLRSAVQGDQKMAVSALSRLVPGGIGINRFVAASPLPSALGLDGLWARHADWGNMHEGRVPIYSGDGALIHLEPAYQTVLRGIGFPMESHRRANEMDRYLAGIRDQASQYKREAVKAMTTGNMRKVRSLSKEFEKKFGVPLTIERSHLSTELRRQSVPRPERLVDRIQPEIRDQFMQMVAGEPQRLAQSAEEFMEATTATGRLRPFRPEGTRISEEQKQLINQYVAEERSRQAIDEGRYVPFESWR